MTSVQIRQSFLDFFKSKAHTIVPSSSLMPDSPNLLFTNAGMNQFVPIFLGQTKCPYTPGRAADTQKCIRAGGKHNDLDDVGLDTYHHTFFEMLGNWSFGDYFKQEAIEWAWELVVNIWKFPPQRLYATVYCPDKSQNDPSEFDQDAWNFWAEKFRSVGLDPAVHIVNGNKKDNFWMMGETGPCGPCSELHVDLTPEGNTQGSLVNKGDARCIEIWNLVFIQFNAQPVAAVCDRRGEGDDDRRSQTATTVEFVPLPACHVDTGMGFERVTSIIQGTKGLTDFANAKISNYETDIFRPIFDAIEKLSGKKYGSTLPLITRAEELPPADDQAVLNDLAIIAISRMARDVSFEAWSTEMVEDYGDQVKPFLSSAWAIGNAQFETEVRKVADSLVARSEHPADGQQVSMDIAFRVIADHIRTLSFAIADGIQPGNTDRNYVLRRILRRAIRYGRTLGFHEPFFYKLVDVLADTMGEVFPEIRAKKKHVQDVIRIEEEAFNKTLDRGILLFEEGAIYRALIAAAGSEGLEYRVVSKAAVFNNDASGRTKSTPIWNGEFKRGTEIAFQFPVSEVLAGAWKKVLRTVPQISGKDAFELYDTYGFPLDLTELMARERGLTVDKEGFEKLMEEQRARARAAQKKEVISLSQIETTTPTKFVGFESLSVQAKVLEVVSLKGKTAVILDTSACYAEMGGQVGDTGEFVAANVSSRSSALSAARLQITNTQKSGNTWLHFVDGEVIPAVGDEVVLRVDQPRREAIQRHHTVTHLLHWAIHEVVSKDASQKGSFVGADKLTFDFNSAPLTPAQVADIEKLVNEHILENAGVSWIEVPYADVKSRPDVMQFFGDKYGEWVRVVQIGGRAGELNGYSMELCGGTHTRATGEIGLFRIVGENAIAAGVRRIEAIAGLEAYRKATDELALIKSLASKVNSPIHELEKKIETMLEQQKALEKQLKAMQQKEAAGAAKALLGKATALNGIPAIIERFDTDGNTLQDMVNELRGQFEGVILLGGAANNVIALVAAVSPQFTGKVQAGKLIQQVAPIVGGKGGGKPDSARGGGKDASKLGEALAKAKSLLG